jgi:hypothetical protein
VRLVIPLGECRTPGYRLTLTLPAMATAKIVASIVVKDAPAGAFKLADFILGGEGQAVLAKYGFGQGDPAPNIPGPLASRRCRAAPRWT